MQERLSERGAKGLKLLRTARNHDVRFDARLAVQVLEYV